MSSNVNMSDIVIHTCLIAYYVMLYMFLVSMEFCDVRLNHTARKVLIGYTALMGVFSLLTFLGDTSSTIKNLPRSLGIHNFAYFGGLYFLASVAYLVFLMAFLIDARKCLRTRNDQAFVGLAIVISALQLFLVVEAFYSGYKRTGGVRYYSARPSTSSLTPGISGDGTMRFAMCGSCQ